MTDWSHWFFQWIAAHGNFAIFSLLALGIIGLPIPDETIIVFSGVLIAEQKLPSHITPFVCYFGTIAGITVSYLLGMSLGYGLISKFGPRVGITENKIQIAHDWFQRVGKWALFIGYFILGVRHLTGYVAGATRLTYLQFALFAYTGALIWVSLFLGLGYFFASNWQAILSLINQYLLIISLIIFLVLLIFLLLKFGGRYLKKKF